MVLLLLLLTYADLAALSWVTAGARLQTFTTVFIGIFIEALPFLLLGVVVSAGIHVFVSPDRVRRLSPRRPLTAALCGAGLGLTILPVCECGTVPATRRLLAKGAPLPLGLAFLLAAPALNPVVIASTWVAFGGQPLLVWGRAGLTLLIAVSVALLISARQRSETALTPAALALEPQHGAEAHGHACAGGHDHHGERTGRVSALMQHSVDELFEMGRLLVLGAAVAAAFQALVPREALLAIGQGPVLAVVALMALAFVLSICSTVDAFIAVGFANAFMPGALLAFLVFGPMVDIKSAMLYGATFRPRTVALLLALPAALTLLAGVAINLYLA